MMNATITEIIPKNMPDWFKKDMEDGQVFCRMVDRVESFEAEIAELQEHAMKQAEYCNELKDERDIATHNLKASVNLRKVSDE